MNWNGQQPYLNHLISLRTDPANAGVTQAAFDALRRKWVRDALTTRPIYIPLNFTLLAAGQVPPFKATTPSLGYDVIVTGIKTDIWPTRDIEFNLTEGGQRLERTGNVPDLFLRSDEIMGCSVDAGGGQVGVFPLPVPFVIPRESRLSVGVYKPGVDGADIDAHIVLVGSRVYDQGFTSGVINNKDSALIDKLIAQRSIPSIRILETPVTYASATLGLADTDIFSPRDDEPLLVLGCRTDLRQSMVEIGITGEGPWTIGEVPSWGIAGETELGYDNYQWYPKPLYLRPNATIAIPRITNGIGGIVDNASGRFTFFCKTV